MTRQSKIIVYLALLAVGFIVYTPHWNYPYPFHVDEWHHIAQSTRMGEGVYTLSLQSAELGFQFFLYLVGSLVNLVTVYQYFPALWAIMSAGAVAWVTYKNFNKNVLITIATIVAFASIKSNVNIIGLWFFTPLTFAIPLIYLYIYFLTKGIAENNRKLFFVGVGIAVGLIFVHAISVFFAVPFLALYTYLHRETFKIHRRDIVIFSSVAVVGFFFAAHILHLSPIPAFIRLLHMITFPYGWGVVEMQNSYTEFYSTTGVFLSLLGVAYLLQHKQRRYYAWYLLWPLTLLIMILVFRLTHYSLLSPYQRNLYYLALSLPPLSGLGTYYGYRLYSKWLKNTRGEPYTAQLVTLLACILLYGLFANYTTLPTLAHTYQPITKEDYGALQFIGTLPEGQVMAEALPSIAIYPISKHDPVASLAFDGKREINDTFMYEESCAEKRDAAFKNPQVRYLLSRVKLYCGWVQIYAKKRYVYDLHP